jgi:hypothetical protein
MGSVEVSTPPLPSVAAQSEIEAQEMPQRLMTPSASTRFHAEDPLAGFVDVRIPPAPSVATQR